MTKIYALTLEHKFAIQQQAREHPQLSQRNIVAWYKQKYGQQLNQSIISRVLNTELPAAAMTRVGKQAGFKRQRKSHWPDLEDALHAWVQRSQRTLTITGDILRAKATQFWQQLPQYHGLPVPAWSNGWLEGFKR